MQYIIIYKTKLNPIIKIVKYNNMKQVLNRSVSLWFFVFMKLKLPKIHSFKIYLFIFCIINYLQRFHENKKIGWVNFWESSEDDIIHLKPKANK